MGAFKKKDKAKKPADGNNNQSKIRPQNKHLVAAKKGQVLNPHGRPKGSRNKFGEAFINDFLEDWELHGKQALKDCRQDDPATYCRIAASIIPRELNINDEREVEKFLSQFTPEEVKQMLIGIRTIEAEAVRNS